MLGERRDAVAEARVVLESGAVARGRPLLDPLPVPGVADGEPAVMVGAPLAGAAALGTLAVAGLTALITVVLGRTQRGERNQDGCSVTATMPAEVAAQAATSNVRAAVPAVEALYSDHGTYAGATIAALREIDPGIASNLKFGWVKNERYCIEGTVDGQTASYTGPSGAPVPGGWTRVGRRLRVRLRDVIVVSRAATARHKNGVPSRPFTPRWRRGPPPPRRSSRRRPPAAAAAQGDRVADLPVVDGEAVGAEVFTGDVDELEVRHRARLATSRATRPGRRVRGSSPPPVRVELINLAHPSGLDVADAGVGARGGLGGGSLP